MWENKWNVIINFNNVSFSFNDWKNLILEESSFTIRENTKITIMWQNWAWKTTIFKLITWELKPQNWRVNIVNWFSIAIAKQILSRDELDLTLRQYFEKAFSEKDYQLDKKIEKVLKEINFNWPIDKKLKDYSGWQQARLLLAFALIQDPDILLLDEPTNNLDKNWIWDLINFLLSYQKTVVVISHDADFLNMFTDWVLYLNKNNNKVEQYRWDYYDVLETISQQIEKERKQNARALKEIEDKKEKINFFSNKWGKMRRLASKLREDVENTKENIVEIRKDDKTINEFDIEFENFIWPIVQIKKVSLINSQNEIKSFKMEIELKKKDKIILEWPNWIWKSTFLKTLIKWDSEYAQISKWVRVWYYSQDFNTLDFWKTVWDSIYEIRDDLTDFEIYRTCSQFLIWWSVLKSKIWSLSEWQKWLVCYAMFVIQKPHLLILDEPTNHINFRHIPVIADAINNFEWGVIVVSHDQTFVEKIKNFRSIDLWKLIG